MKMRWISPLVCGGLLLSASLAQAAPTVINCAPAKLKIMASALESTTSSTNFVNLPEAAVNFTQAGPGPSCVVVRFSAMALTSNNSVNVRAILENNTTALPSDVGFATDDLSFEFVFPSVAPGNHAVRLQYKSFSGQAVTIKRRNTVVQYR